MFPITPQTSVETLFIEGVLSLRAKKVLTTAGINDVRAIAAYHLDDPRYLTLAGCGKTTRRELNGVIKAAYGSLSVSRSTIFPRPQTDAPLPWSLRREGTLSAPSASESAETRYRKRCERYAELILQRKGVPESPADLELHRWYLRQAQLRLTSYRAEAFTRLSQLITSDE